MFYLFLCYTLFSTMFIIVFNSLSLFVPFNDNFSSLFIQFLNMAILCSPGLHELLSNVMSVAADSLYCLFL